jgi:hypothetical protein
VGPRSSEGLLGRPLNLVSRRKPYNIVSQTAWYDVLVEEKKFVNPARSEEPAGGDQQEGGDESLRFSILCQLRWVLVVTYFVAGVGSAG